MIVGTIDCVELVFARPLAVLTDGVVVDLFGILLLMSPIDFDLSDGLTYIRLYLLYVNNLIVIANLLKITELHLSADRYARRRVRSASFFARLRFLGRCQYRTPQPNF